MALDELLYAIGSALTDLPAILIDAAHARLRGELDETGAAELAELLRA